MEKFFISQGKIFENVRYNSENFKGNLKVRTRQNYLYPRLGKVNVFKFCYYVYVFCCSYQLSFKSISSPRTRIQEQEIGLNFFPRNKRFFHMIGKLLEKFYYSRSKTFPYDYNYNFHILCKSFYFLGEKFNLISQSLYLER